MRSILINIWAMNTPLLQPLTVIQPRPALAEAVRATDLLKNRQVLVIEHDGERYLLRLTKNGKLILTK